MGELIIGVTIEDKHISAGLVDIETRKVIKNTVQRKRVDPSASLEQIVASWTGALKEVSSSSKKMGVGLPGKCDYESGQYLDNDPVRYHSLYQKNIKEIFSNIIDSGSENIRLMNDAACFLQGEVFGGAGRGFQRSLGVTLGMGLGTAIYSNGVVKDANLHGSPFNDGTAEDYISIRWLLKRLKQNGIEIKDLSELSQHTGNPAIQQVFDEFGLNLTKFLVSFIKQHSPEVVIIGGYIQLYNRYFFDNVAAAIKAEGIKTAILRAILGEEASIIGAASTWYNAAQIHA